MGEDKQLLDLLKDTPNIIGQVYIDVAQPSAKVVGAALSTVFEFSTSFLLPIKLLNEKFKLNFAKRLEEYRIKLEQIPEDKRCEVHPQIGTPLIEKLSYTTNDEIADLFTTLLANASNLDMVNTAHPSFVSLIERLSPDEARIIAYLKGRDDIQYCHFKAEPLNCRGYKNIYEYLTLVQEEVDLDYSQNLKLYLSNLISLGVLVDMVDVYRVDDTIYNQIVKKYDFEGLQSRFVPNIYKKLSITKSYFKVTDYGKLFITSCVK